MTKNIKKSGVALILFFFFSCFLFFSPLETEAAGLVPCGGDGEPVCTLCHLIIGIDGIIDWGFKILVFVAVLVIVIAGIMYIVSTGNDQEMEKAKNMVKQALTGAIIVFGAWLIVNTTMLMLGTQSDLGLGINVTGWSTFSCEAGAAVVTEEPVIPICGDGRCTGDENTTCPSDCLVGVCTGTESACCKPSMLASGKCAACSGCVAFSNGYSALCYRTNGNSCQLNSGLATKLQNANLSSVGLQVSEAWPPTVTHSSACHANGTCADVRCMSGCRNETPASIKIKYDAMKNAGLNVLFETTSGNCGPYTALGINCSSPSTMTNPSFHVS